MYSVHPHMSHMCSHVGASMFVCAEAAYTRVADTQTLSSTRWRFWMGDG